MAVIAVCNAGFVRKWNKVCKAAMADFVKSCLAVIKNLMFLIQ